MVYLPVVLVAIQSKTFSNMQAGNLMMSKWIQSLVLAIIKSEYLTKESLYKLELRSTALHDKSFPPYKIWIMNEVMPTQKPSENVWSRTILKTFKTSKN